MDRDKDSKHFAQAGGEGGPSDDAASSNKPLNLNAIAADLAAHIEDQRQTWGDMDEVLLARYDAGMCTEEERQKVEQAVIDFPAVRESTEFLRLLRAEQEARPSDGEPVVERRAERKTWTGRTEPSEQEPGTSR